MTYFDKPKERTEEEQEYWKKEKGKRGEITGKEMKREGIKAKGRKRKAED